MANLNPPRTPHLFSNPGGNWVATSKAASIFQVKVNLRHKLSKDGRDQDEYAASKERYRELLSKVEDKKNQSSSSRPKKMPKGEKDIIVPYSGERCSTGFIIAQSGDDIKIMTCASTVREIFHSGCHEVTAEDIDAIYQFDIVCIHQEREVVTRDSDLPVSQRNRTTTNAVVVAVDTELDLLVLESSVLDLYVYDVADEGEMCHSDHPIIHFADIPPQVQEHVILLGWPPKRPEATVPGWISSLPTKYDGIGRINTKGYTMGLTEVARLNCAEGFSGGPLLNANSRCVGVYHGSLNNKDRNGYVVSLEDIHTFLDRFNVLQFDLGNA